MTDWTLPLPALLPLTPRGALEDAQTREITTALAQAGVSIDRVEVDAGPQAMRYRVFPAPGVAPSKLERATDVVSIATGRTARCGGITGHAVSFEVARGSRELVGLREHLPGDIADAPLRFAVGVDLGTDTITADLGGLPHVLVAGTTGSGKSEFLNQLITALVMNYTPDDLHMVMIDPKRVELTAFEALPHLARPIVTDATDAVSALGELVALMDGRYSTFESVGVKSLGEYNSAIEYGTLEAAPMPRVVVVIDELADLMMTAAKVVEEHIQRLGQLARAAGIHLVLATQRPDAKTVTPKIKANIPARAVFRVNSHYDSNVSLGFSGAERLAGRGDGLWLSPGNDPVRFQSPFVARADIDRVVKHWALQTPPPAPVEEAPVEVVDDYEERMRAELDAMELPTGEAVHVNPLDILSETGLRPAQIDALMEVMADRLGSIVLADIRSKVGA